MFIRGIHDPSFDLTGQVAIVTGSSRAASDDRRPKSWRRWARRSSFHRARPMPARRSKGIRDKGGDATVIPCNISRKERSRGAREGDARQVGGAHRHARLQRGPSIRSTGRCRQLPDEAFDKSWARTSRATSGSPISCAPIMAAQGGGSIVIVSSIGGIRGTDVTIARHLRHIEGRRFRARPQHRGGMGTEERAPIASRRPS